MDKTITLEALAGKVESGMTLGIGGWGGRRKPMAFIRALLNTDVQDLTLIACGGPDVGMLAAAGKIRKLVFSFVTMDLVPLEAHFRKARQTGAFEIMELDEGMFLLGLKAAAARLPFLPTRAGLASDVLTTNPEIKTIRSPYDDDEELIAVPALNMDIAVCHVNQTDQLGNSIISAPDPFFDEWFCRAAQQAYLTTEEVVATDTFNDPMLALQMPIERNLVQGVALASLGAHPTSCGPAYGMDINHMSNYNATAKEGVDNYLREFVTGKSLPDYIEKVGGADAIRALPVPVF
ncbi:MAG: CoA transferase subunit A [Pseudomonadales bacterium]